MLYAWHFLSVVFVKRYHDLVSWSFELLWLSFQLSHLCEPQIWVYVNHRNPRWPQAQSATFRSGCVWKTSLIYWGIHLILATLLPLVRIEMCALASQAGPGRDAWCEQPRSGGWILYSIWVWNLWFIPSCLNMGKRSALPHCTALLHWVKGVYVVFQHKSVVQILHTHRITLHWA